MPATQPVPVAATAPTQSAAAPAVDFYSPPIAAPPAYPAPVSGYPGATGYQSGAPGQYGFPPPAPARPTRSRLLPRIGKGLLVVVVLGVIRGGCSAVWQSRDITVPTRLSGYEQVSGPMIDSSLVEMKSYLEKENPGKAVAVAAYGTDGTPSFVLGVLRGRVDVDKELKDAQLKSRKDFGPVTCAKTGVPGQVGCLWTGSVSGAVFALDMKMADLAAIAQEARQLTD